jgi:aspartate/tyrosine/aromatic aminotransferase
MSDWDDELTGNQTRNRIEALESQLAEAKAEVKRLKVVLSSQDGMFRELIATQEDLRHEMKGTEMLTTERDRYKLALEQIAEVPNTGGAEGYFGSIARTALESGGTK